MSFTVFVDGQEGTTGLRTHEYLAQRRDVEVLRIDANLRKDNAERARLLNAAELHPGNANRVYLELERE